MSLNNYMRMGLIVQCRCPFKLANKFLVAYSWVFELIQTFPSLRLWKFTWHVTVIVNEKGSICGWSHASVGVSYTIMILFAFTYLRCIIKSSVMLLVGEA